MIAIIDPANIPSQRVAAKIGLTQEKETAVFGIQRVIYAADI
jgi:RimJ/RimL family protein N-acetyltransferase